MDLNERIDSRVDSLTKSEKRLAAYLQRNLDEAAFFSAADLAAQLGLSEATVTRFAQSLGFSGFSELRRYLQALFRDKVSHASRLQKRLAELSTDDHILEQAIRAEIQYLTDAIRTLSQPAFDQAVRLVCNARRVFVYGLSGSAMIAQILAHRLRRFGLDVIPITQSGREVCEELLMLEQDDVFVAMLFFNLSHVTVSTLEYAKHRGCQVILLTDTLGPYLGEHVDVLLEAHRGSVMAFHSLVVPMAVIQALVLAVAEVDERKSMDTLNRLDDIRDRLGFVASVRV